MQNVHTYLVHIGISWLQIKHSFPVIFFLKKPISIQVIENLVFLVLPVLVQDVGVLFKAILGNASRSGQTVKQTGK